MFRPITLVFAVLLLSRLHAADPITPKVENDAHAEAILWEVWFSDEINGGYPHTVTKNRLRVIVFNERGAEMLSKADIPHLGSRHISDV